MIQAGTLNERITFQQATETRNVLGEMVPVWSDIATVWARVEGVSAREYLSAGQMDVTITHKVTIRYRSELTQKMRVIWRGRTLEIVSLLEHDNRTRHELICTETQP
jgi:SPP1 family predicted phage head-tail adaptor